MGFKSKSSYLTKRKGYKRYCNLWIFGSKLVAISGADEDHGYSTYITHMCIDYTRMELYRFQDKSMQFQEIQTKLKICKILELQEEDQERSYYTTTSK